MLHVDMYTCARMSLNVLAACGYRRIGVYVAIYMCACICICACMGICMCTSRITCTSRCGCWCLLVLAGCSCFLVLLLRVLLCACAGVCGRLASTSRLARDGILSLRPCGTHTRIRMYIDTRDAPQPHYVQTQGSICNEQAHSRIARPGNGGSAAGSVIPIW